MAFLSNLKAAYDSIGSEISKTFDSSTKDSLPENADDSNAAQRTLSTDVADEVCDLAGLRSFLLASFYFVVHLRDPQRWGFFGVQRWWWWWWGF